MTTFVPGSNGGLIDLGGGMVAPSVPGQSTLVDLGVTPSYVTLDANGYPIDSRTGLPWSGAQQQQMLAGILSPAPSSGTSSPTTTSGGGLTFGAKYRFYAPTGPASDVGTPSSGLTTFGSAPVATVDTSTPSTTSPANATSGALTSGPASSSGSDSGLIQSLMDLVAAQYAGAGVPGGGTGFGGLVTAPLAGTDYVGGGTASAAPASHKGLIILALLVAGIGYWYYRSHHKTRAAA